MKRYHIILASIAFAILMWLGVNMRYTYTIVRAMPVVLENQREGKALKYPIPKQMMVRFRGSGWMLAALYLSPDVKYFIDVASLSNEDFIVTGRDVLEHVKLPVPVEVLDIKPDTLVLALDDYREKRVRVIPQVVVDFHEGYGQVGLMEVAPESVLVGGTRSLVEQINGWPTVYSKFSDVRGPISATVALDQPTTYAIELFRSNVQVNVDVQPFAEKTFLGIPVAVMQTPMNRDVLLIPPKMDIIVRGGIERLAKLTSEDFHASVNYNLLTQDTTGSIIPLLEIPEEIKVVSRKPERFQYIIRKRL